MSNVPMTMPELVLAEHENAYGHESTFVELDDGRITHSSRRPTSRPNRERTAPARSTRDRADPGGADI